MGLCIPRKACNTNNSNIQTRGARKLYNDAIYRSASFHGKNT